MEIDSRLFSTDYVPTFSERVSIKALLAHQYEEIQALDLEVASYLEKLETLRKRQRELQKSCGDAESLLAPIRRLPTEILQKIFLLTISDFFTHYAAQSDHTESKPVICSIRFLQIDPHRDRIHLSLVSRRWKTIVDETPEAWRTIKLIRPLPTDMSLISRRFAKAKSCTLDVCFSPHGWCQDDPLVSRMEMYRDLISLIKQHAQQLRVFVVRIVASEADVVLNELFPPRRFNVMPNMTVFGLIIPDGMAQYKLIGSVNAPALSFLAADMTFNYLMPLLSDDSLKSLTQLMLKTEISLPESILHRLSLCANLITLHWTHSNNGPTDIESRLTTQIYFPHLRSLYLALSNMNPLDPMFSLFDAPGLQSFGLSANFRKLDGLAALAAFFPSQSYTIQQLHFDNLDINGNAREVFSIFPHLKSVKFVSCILNPSFFSLLADPICPPLNHIIIYYRFDGSFSLSDLIYYVDFRMSADSVTKLSRVEIDCSLNDAKDKEINELMRIKRSYGDVVDLGQTLTRGRFKLRI